MQFGLSAEARTSGTNIFLGEKQLEEVKLIQYLGLNIDRSYFMV